MTAKNPPSGFIEAFQSYIRNLPEKKNEKLVLSRLDLNEPPTPESIQASMSRMEARHAQKPSVKIMKRILTPAIMAMKDYYGVLDTLTQADPTPGMIVWGTLKIVVDGLGRFIDLFDIIKTELMSLTTQLRRMTLYEELYGESKDMQEHLFRSYTNVFRFWCRVDKECNRCSFSTLLRASVSFSLKKLQSIVNDLKENADQIDKLVPIIEGQYAGLEREEARFERIENKKERDEGSEWRKQMQSDRIISWLGGQKINESNLTCHQNNLHVINEETTCDWLFRESMFQEWVDGTSAQPIIWLFAGPGSGKSILCSHAYRYVENLVPQTRAAVALHFYAFDSQNTALVTARGLAAQLFAQYWCVHKDIPDDIKDASQKSAANLESVLGFIRILAGRLPRVYIFFDGLDEECNQARWKEAVKMIDFVISLAETFPHIIRLWYSAQDTFLIRKKLEKFPALNIKGRIARAVDEYISTKVPGLDNVEVDRETRDWIVTELKSRADGNFLWASLMLKTIENEVSNVDEMELFIEKGLPKDLDQYYRQIFSRYEMRERDLASKIFALITFAKRRLRLSELREAIGVISSSNPKMLKSSCIPWRHAVERLFAPFIETKPDPGNTNDPFCHLFHGTVRDFLLKNPDIFRVDQAITTIRLMSPMTIADACLLYLSQEKYSQLIIKRRGLWATASGEEISRHHLLTYSAKYWDKHLDEVEGTPQLLQRVENFLTSPNFQTLLQAQSLFVEGHFGLYVLQGHVESHKYTKRVFPWWLTEKNAGGCVRFSTNYRSFISEWQSLLDCGTGCKDCYDYTHYVRYAGELDRCLWKALGPCNFLSNNRERYLSFMLSSGQKSQSSQTALCLDGVAADGRSVVVLKSSKRRNESGRLVEGESSPYHQEVWGLPNHAAPVLLTQENLVTDPKPQERAVSGILPDKNRNSGSAKILSFSPDLSYIRIGSEIFSKDSNRGYVTIEGLDLTTANASACLEDITSRGPFLVLASRQRMPRTSYTRGRTTEQNANDKEELESTDRHLRLDPSAGDCSHCSRDPSRNKDRSNSSLRKQSREASSEHSDSTHEDLSSPSSTESLGWNSAEETWSEASTDIAQLEEVHWNNLDSSEEESSTTSEYNGDSEDESQTSPDEELSKGPVHSYGQLLDEDESDGGGVDLNCGSDDDAYQGDSDNSDMSYQSDANDGVGFDSDDENAIHRRLFMKALGQQRSKFPEGCLIIYDMFSNPPKVIFRYSQSLPLKLYESPPAIHPTRPLVVWPLFAGDMLFVDFEANSYFIRRTQTSTRRTRHVFMKCNFSPCGRYLHMVSLEAQEMLLSKAERKKNAKPSLALSAFLSTHRLSNRKTTRSPPSLVYRAKISLGSTQRLNPTRMPVEVTWSPKFVYLSRSSEHHFLSLFRLNLFGAPAKQETNSEASPVVSVPRLPIILPQSARSRKLHFFPPSRPEDTHALVLIGSWDSTSGEGQNTSARDGRNAVQGHPEPVSPPIGLYVSEEEDLGGWVESNAEVEIPPESDKGALKAKLERFAPEDDCDIEHFFFAHPPKY